VNPLPQPVGIEHRMDSSRVSALKVALRANASKVGPPNLFPSIDAAQPGPEQHQRRFHHAAVEMRGFSLRSETCVTISLESWKIFPHRRSGGEEPLSFLFLKSFHSSSETSSISFCIKR